MALSTNQLGPRVYNMSSYAPNRGQVNATGYLQREIRNNAQKQGPYGGVSQWGNDGQSDTRSGVAAQALARQGAMRTLGQQQVQQAPIGRPKPAPQAAAQQANSSTVIPSNFQTRNIKVGSTGTLQIPFNQKFNAQQRALKTESEAALRALVRQVNEDDLLYAQQQSDGVRNYDSLKESNLSDAADRGSVFSSGYGKQVMDSATDFNRLMQDTQGEQARSHNQFSLDANAVQRDFLRGLMDLSGDAVKDAAQKAGTKESKKGIKKIKKKLKKKKGKKAKKAKKTKNAKKKKKK